MSGPCEHVKLYTENWQGLHRFEPCLLCERDDLKSKLQEVLKDNERAGHELASYMDQCSGLMLRLDSANGGLVNARLDQQKAEARQDELASMLAATERQRDSLAGRLDSGSELLRQCLECDATGNSVPNVAIEQWLGAVERQRHSWQQIPGELWARCTRCGIRGDDERMAEPCSVTV